MTKRTEIATLGEFGLIRHLTKDIELKNASTRKGVGDDAAVMDYGDKEVLMTTDLLLEGVHFDLTYVPLKHLGYKSAVVNFSDIYAMNGQPKQITVSIGLSKRFCIEDLEELYSGIRLACDVYGVDLVGGDTSASMTGLCISITCLLHAPTQVIISHRCNGIIVYGYLPQRFGLAPQPCRAEINGNFIIIMCTAAHQRNQFVE